MSYSGTVIQLAESKTFNLEVVGSSPTRPIINKGDSYVQKLG